MPKPKYRPGAQIKSLVELVCHLNRNGWTYYRNKPMSPKWLKNWSFTQLEIAIFHHSLRYAELIEQGE